MRVLAIETSTAWGSVALVDAGGIMAERSARVPGQHLEWLLPAIGEVLADARGDRGMVDGLAVSVGPGRFNGLRIGLATASAWAVTTPCPMVGISTLDAIAGGQPATESLVLAVLDVRRAEVAAALYRHVPALTRLTPDLVAPPQRLREVLPPIAEPLVVTGDGLERYQAVVLAALAPWATSTSPGCWRPQASIVGRLGRARLVRGEHDDPLTLGPIYARPVDAREFVR